MFYIVRTLLKKIYNYLKIYIKKWKLFKRILADRNLINIGIQDTVIQIANNYIGVRSLDFIYREIASFIVNIGHAHYAEPYFMYSLKISNDPISYSLYLQSLLLDPNCSEQKLYEAALQYNQFYANISPYKVYKNVLNPNKQLTIGYMCHFFYNSVSQSLLVPFLKAHHRGRVKVICYSDAEPHEVTEDTRKCADVWRETKHLDDEALSLLIREDRVDILLELNGHVLSNRYGVIARRPAPIQINYYNQSATTGIKAFDYIIVGEEINIDQTKYIESIYQMKGVQGVAIFPDTFPPVSSLPCEEKGHIVFGSFGAAHKVNTEVIKLWCEILKRVPNAKLFMKAGVLTFEAYLRVYKKLFIEGGIELNRIHFEGFSDHRTMLECYAQIDIALDTFPHAAGTTTMEAIWQGVPVITLCGKKYSSKNGRIVLTTIGHPELVAYSPEEYICKAVQLANNKERLIQYRKSLRDDFKNSELANASSFVRRLEDSYITMWQRYCTANHPIRT